MTGKQSSFFGIDERVVYTMVAVCIVSIVILAFRFAADKPCTGVSMAYGTDSIFVNEPVHFRVGSGRGRHFSWKFGDGNELDNGTSSEVHRYKEARKYTVKVVMDGSCTDIRELEVYKAKWRGLDSGETLPLALPLVNLRQTAFTGDKVKFADASFKSTSWKWYFEGSPQVYSREREVLYSFKRPGTHKIHLVVNDDPSLSFTGYISIRDKPDDGVPNDPPPVETIEDRPPPIVHNLSNEQWSAALKEVSKGTKHVQDFSVYICPNQELTVLYETMQYSFRDFCNKLKSIGDENIRDIKILTIRRTANNCISSMQVDIVKVERPVVHNLSNEQWSEALMDVSKGTKLVQDFSEYICANQEITVVYETTQYSFKEFCDKLKSIGNENIKDIKITLIRRSTNNCISSMQVTIVKAEPLRPLMYSDKQWSDALMDVSNGTKTAHDLSSYLCGNLDVKVLCKVRERGRPKEYTFRKLCDKLKSIRGKNIEAIAVSQMRRTGDNCISGMEINVTLCTMCPW